MKLLLTFLAVLIISASAFAMDHGSSSMKSSQRGVADRLSDVLNRTSPSPSAEELTQVIDEAKQLQLTANNSGNMGMVGRALLIQRKAQSKLGLMYPAAQAPVPLPQ